MMPALLRYSPSGAAASAQTAEFLLGGDSSSSAEGDGDEDSVEAQIARATRLADEEMHRRHVCDKTKLRTQMLLHFPERSC